MIDPAFEHYTLWLDISDAMVGLGSAISRLSFNALIFWLKLLYPSISGHKTWLVGIIIVLSILQSGTGIGQYNLDAIPASSSGLLLKLHFTLAVMAYVMITGSVLSLYARGTLIAQVVAFASTILCDALISGSLVYFLREKPLNRSMRIGIGKITIYSINIGLITVAVSAITLITWLAAPHPQFTWQKKFSSCSSLCEFSTRVVECSSRDPCPND
ncbi:hypothetical protein M422DRAFT_258082 [Sphaerobolus stellatus SS14]|uniref:Unplaced genomic scaffold SPHSTscaffold_79, whole genome shotgun sequence n=1 Tax=Sphaerobolus stellatus (strain SS14) TaxID=990650 RepID=A0A0C9U841_SPHS4|nr:hypothetical protein M422DRAFT_258082 [Sphaerobolus stellatus SS14]